MKVGIVCDDDKVEKYKKELTANDFTDFTITPFKYESSTIAVNTSPHRIKELHKLCKKVEFEIKNSN